MKTTVYTINAPVPADLKFVFLSDIHEKNTDEAYAKITNSNSAAI